MSNGVQNERPTVLVVEDEFLVGLDLSETVQDLGYGLEGPFEDTKNALEAIEEQMPDVAILDVYTADGEVYPVADALTEKGVPIIFHSGHVPPQEVRERYPDAMACSKPCPPGEIIGMVQEAVARASQS